MAGFGPDASEHPLLYELVKENIDQVNSELADFEAIKKFAIIGRKFTEERGELTPTLKIKQRVVISTFKNEIEDLYA